MAKGLTAKLLTARLSRPGGTSNSKKPPYPLLSFRIEAGTAVFSRRKYGIRGVSNKRENTASCMSVQRLFGLLNLLVMPAIPVMALNLSSRYAMDWNSVISILIPFFIGMILGNLGDEISKMQK